MVVAGIGLRIFARTLPPVQLHRVAPTAAARLVSDFIASSRETDFGYPSGAFLLETARDNEVVAKEWVAKGSHFTQILRGFYRAIMLLGAPFGCLGLYITLFFAALVTPFLLIAAALETLLKYLLQSRIRAVLERNGDGTQVTFTLRGPTALLVGRRLERAFNQPVLPPRVAALAGVATDRPTVSDPSSAGAAA